MLEQPTDNVTMILYDSWSVVPQLSQETQKASMSYKIQYYCPKPVNTLYWWISSELRKTKEPGYIVFAKVSLPR